MYVLNEASEVVVTVGGVVVFGGGGAEHLLEGVYFPKGQHTRGMVGAL